MQEYGAAPNSTTHNLSSTTAPRSLSSTSPERDPVRLDENEWHPSLKTVDHLYGTADSFVTSQNLSKPCAFGADIFAKVMENLVRNPNITSSHLFRADIYYDSEKDASFSPGAWEQLQSSAGLGVPDECAELSSFIKHMRKDIRPRRTSIDGFELRRVLVRRMVPRNPGLDRELVQTCCFLRSRAVCTSRDERAATNGSRNRNTSLKSTGNNGIPVGEDRTLERHLVVYVPHVDAVDNMPWYHPKVQAVAFLHEWNNASKVGDENRDENQGENDAIPMPGRISIHIIPFASSTTSDSLHTGTDQPDRLHRTLQNLLRTITRHGAGQLAGYKKRGNHDRLIEQSALQDTYTRLKQKHAKYILHECWRETTDATKGVFEDLGIAAFLIELWRGMYAPPEAEVQDSSKPSALPPFPGFVDIGCGNGVLVYILLSEGFRGYGFDARMRKTWKAFPATIQANLERRVLIPSILSTGSSLFEDESPDGKRLTQEASISSASMPVTKHDGIFPRQTFIISNHADELSAWTPLLSYLSDCPFICIPCCSHDLTGARFRAPASSIREDDAAQSLCSSADCAQDSNGKPKVPQPSAYASLTAYIAHLSRAVGYEVEREVLRIPSTRNHCIVGRRRPCAATGGEASAADSSIEQGREAPVETKQRRVLTIVEHETQKPLSYVRDLWCARAAKISNPTNGLDSSSKH